MKAVPVKREQIFNSWIVLAVSLSGAVVIALYALRSPTTRSRALESSGAFLYVIPIVVPFLAFLFDRAERFTKLNHLHFIVDTLVVATALGRVVANVPFVSGHTLFLTYAILTSRSLVVRVTALLVMAQTIYLKYFVWHDFVTSTSGIVLGAIAAYFVSRWGRRSPSMC